MFPKVRFLLASVALASALVLTACGGEGTNSSASVTVDTNDGLAFVQTTLTAPASGTSVQFNNKSAGLQHNWVLVNGGDDVAAAVNAAGQADTTDYVPDGDPNVIVAAKLLNSGESETVQVPALSAGTYTYICTFPGHYDAGMKGVMTVQ